MPTANGYVKPGRSPSVYSEVEISRLKASIPLPSILKSSFSVVDGPKTSATGNPDEIAKLFPNLFGQPSVSLKAGGSLPTKSLKIGVILSGGQAPGGHNVISGIFDYLHNRTKNSTIYGFKGGPIGFLKCKYVHLSHEFVYPYRNQGGFDMICSGRDKIETPQQFHEARETAKMLDLDGIVVIGGDDSNTNACLLAENFRAKGMKTRVIGCPKTIDGDLKCKEVPTSFGFDTACKIYSEMIGNLMVDARSTGKYYHFVRLMGRAASHITLECALQTHPNITIIGEEVAAQKQTLKSITNYITNIICKRADVGYNYGIILIPEGLIDFVPEVQQLIAELNEIIAHGVVDQQGAWKKKLRSQSHDVFEILPKAIQEQLLLERDPHGNVQVSKIETEKMLIQMVEAELEKRKCNKNFKGQPHFFGYEGRCGLPSNFDSNYCYALGYGAAALLHSGKTGLISSVGNLGARVEDWTVGGMALTSLMDLERRQGKFKPVIKKAMVELQGAPFKKFASMRDEWSLKNRYINPGPVQFFGPTSDLINHTLRLELGSQA
ncbi:pyrophosphate--fructose 6-phosphate 1-phosphotransferase subunit beta 1-like [Bidens hawaiensis]|uniref:pyrophosphate--fructose 6-phosphate 1-phosphotransferase subunit beta 1-like n=1 Tax=Bidens hawaiensis TaxID=980011 RepID=UPI00404B3F6E